MTNRAKTDGTSLPSSRVRTIMRSSPDVSSISPDAIALVSHSASLFIGQLVRDAYTQSVKQSNRGIGEPPPVLDYKHLSSAVTSNERLSFLQDIVPHKVKVKDYLATARPTDQIEDELESDT